MSPKNELAGPITSGLCQLDPRTLVSVRLARSSKDPVRYRAVALSVLRDGHRIAIASTLTAGYGTDTETATQECLERVKSGLERRRLPQLQRYARRPEPSL